MRVFFNKASFYAVFVGPNENAAKQLLDKKKLKSEGGGREVAQPAKLNLLLTSMAHV